MEEIIQKIKLVITSPRKFFANLKEEKIEKPFVYFILLGIMNLVLNSLVGSFAVTQKNYIAVFLVSVPFFLLGVILSFVAVGILHLWLKIFGGKGNYRKTYQLWAYSNTPSWLLNWIPIVAIVGAIYTIILLIIGTQELHKIKRNTAILIIVIPAVVLVILSIFIASIIAVARGI